MSVYLGFEAIEHETEKALLVRFEDQEEPTWVPRSVVEEEYADGLEVAQWWAEKEGLI